MHSLFPCYPQPYRQPPFSIRAGAAALFAAILFVVGCQPAQPAATPAPATPTASPTPQPTVTVAVTASSTPVPSATPQPDWYQIQDLSSTSLALTYAFVTNPDARLYTSLQDAIRQTNNFNLLPYSPAYVALVNAETHEGKTYHQLRLGRWMQAEDLQVLSPSTFRGILLTREIDFQIGWVLGESQSVDKDGRAVRWYARYQIVREHSPAAARAGMRAIGENEWLAEDAVAWLQPAIPPEAGPYTCRFVHVDLSEQTLGVYEACKLVFATLVSSGQNPRWTQPGRYAILYEADLATLKSPAEFSGEYYLDSVPYFMTYYGELGFHTAYWHDHFGFAVSHGCINLSPADARWLFEWAAIGDVVVVTP